MFRRKTDVKSLIQAILEFKNKIWKKKNVLFQDILVHSAYLLLLYSVQHKVEMIYSLSSVNFIDRDVEPPTWRITEEGVWR